MYYMFVVIPRFGLEHTGCSRIKYVIGFCSLFSTSLSRRVYIRDHFANWTVSKGWITLEIFIWEHSEPKFKKCASIEFSNIMRHSPWVTCIHVYTYTGWLVGTDIFYLFISQAVRIFETSSYTYFFTDMFPFWH